MVEAGDPWLNVEGVCPMRKVWFSSQDMEDTKRVSKNGLLIDIAETYHVDRLRGFPDGVSLL